MTSFYVCVAYILILQTFSKHRCLAQNSTDASSITSAEYQSTLNSSITVKVTTIDNVVNVTDVMQMTSPDGMTSPGEMTSQDGITSPDEMTSQDGMTSTEGMTSPDEMTSTDERTSQNETTSQNGSTYSYSSYTTELQLEPSPTLNLVTTDLEISYTLEISTITEDYYLSSLDPVTEELQPSQSLDVTSLMTERFESMVTTESSTGSSSFVPDVQTSGPSLPVPIPLDIPTSSMMAPSASLTVVSTATLTLSTTTPSPKHTTKPVIQTTAVEDFKFTMQMDGNCEDVKQEQDEYVFKQACIKAITERTGVERDQVLINDIRCGSIILDFTFYDRTGGDKGTEMLEMASEEEPLIIRFKDVDYQVVLVESFTTDSSDDGGLSIEEQRLLIYIIAGGLCGFVVILAIGVCLGQSCRNRIKKRDKDISFQTEHLTKLSDMNLTTTIIPRPKSIYANVGDYETRCSLFAITNNYYYYNNGAFMYDDETQPNGEITSSDGEGGVMVAVEVEPTTPGAKASEQFGLSGIPEWNLPQLEGVVRAGSEIEGSDTASVHEFSRPSSRTFSVPFPPPPPPLPATDHDATVTDIVLPVPQLNRQSDAFSEITDSSSGDTNMLLRGGSQRKEKQGLDNGGLQVDENKTQDNTLTRNTPGSQLASYEALSRL